VITVLSIVAVSAISSARISSNFLCFVIVVIPPSLVWHITEYQPDFAIIVYLTKLSTRSVYQMRKLTPQEKLEKQLAREAHIHSADCGHEVAVEPVAEEVVAEPVVVEVATEEVAPVAEEVVAEEAVAEEAPAEEAVVEGKPKKKSAPKY
jgi:hypothetical protein